MLEFMKLMLMGKLLNREFHLNQIFPLQSVKLLNVDLKYF